MKPIAALLRRYSVTLFLVAIALLASATILQSVRLRYLEQRHHQMLHDFGKGQIEMQSRFNQLTKGCAQPAG